MSEVIKKRLAVVGSRTFSDKAKLYDVLTKNLDRIKLIVSGGARGADSLAVEWATDFGIPYLVFPALWRDPFTGVQNKGAGFKRNVQIVEQADVVMAFWDGKSAGTAHTIEMAKQRNKPVRIIKFDEPVPKESVPIDMKTGKPIDVAHKDLPVVPKGYADPPGSLCCSMPTCEHQEPDPEGHGEAEAMMGEEGSPCGCSGMPPCCSGHMEDSIIHSAYQEAKPASDVHEAIAPPEEDNDATL